MASVVVSEVYVVVVSVTVGSREGSVTSSSFLQPESIEHAMAAVSINAVNFLKFIIPVFYS